eukprot:14992809-Ditylum_brightwellii.AAC.1
MISPGRKQSYMLTYSEAFDLTSSRHMAPKKPIPSMASISTEAGIWGLMWRTRQRTSLPMDGICVWERGDVTDTSMGEESFGVMVRVPTTLE